MAGARQVWWSLALMFCLQSEATWYDCVDFNHLAITFDDGPGPYTPQVLDVLRAHGVKATFFVGGQNITKYPQLLRAIYEEGHVIGAHSYHHPSFATISTDRMRDEMIQCDTAVQDVLGVSPVLFRYPHGEHSPESDKVVAESHKIVFWNVDTGDWNVASWAPERIFEDFPGKALEVTEQGRGPMYLAHSEWYKESADALDPIISWGKQRGYTFVTVPKCVNFEGDVYMKKNLPIIP